MFGLTKLKKRINQNSQEAYKRVRPTITVRQETVLKAIQNLGPCYYRDISRHLRTIDGSVTPRIAELKRKELIRVKFVKVGPSRARVSYYEITGLGMRHLIEKMGSIK